MIKEIIIKMIYCFIGTLFFALIMNSPKNVLFHSSFIASVGYLIFSICVNAQNEKLGFFLATSVIVFLGEIFARSVKMPATIFIFPAVVPIVPGLGLYQTMLALVQDDIIGALEIGVDTIFNIGAMAIAMSLMSIIVAKMPKKNNIKNSAKI